MLIVRNLRSVAAGVACLAVAVFFLVSCDKSNKSCTCVETIGGESRTMQYIPSSVGVADCASLEKGLADPTNPGYFISCR